MASSRHAGHAGPCLSGRCASARHQGERTSTSRQTCCPSRFPRCAGSSGVSSGQSRPIPVASSLGRTGDDDTSNAPDDHTGPAEPEVINPGCSTSPHPDGGLEMSRYPTIKPRPKKLPWPVFLLICSLFVPWIIYIGPVRLSSYRIVLLAMVLPCLVRWLSG